jgi:hypothetical protein
MAFPVRSPGNAMDFRDLDDDGTELFSHEIKSDHELLRDVRPTADW